MNTKRLTLCAGLVLSTFAWAAPTTPTAKESCFPLLDAALAKDIKAAASKRDKNLEEAVQAYAAAEKTWEQASQSCQGKTREQALLQWGEARQNRQQLADQIEPPGCKQANAQAQQLLTLTRDAWNEKQWPEAALWARKTELALNSASEQCTGERQSQAMQKRASIQDDLHNAAHCGPLWEKTSELTARLKQDLPKLLLEEKQKRQDELESAWSQVASHCRGPVAEQGREAAERLGKTRGSRSLTASPAEKPAADKGTGAQELNYSGSFSSDAQGRMSGTGHVAWANGDRYEGSLLNGRPHGKGSFIWQSGQRYDGEFVDGQPSGNGKMNFAGSGDRYEGEFLDGKPQGKGRYVWKNGEQYAGEWKNGLKHGKGRYSWPNGKAVDGDYANDVRQKGDVVQVSPINLSLPSATELKPD